MNLKLSERFWKIIFRIQNRLKSNRFHKLLLSLPTTVFIVVAKVSFVRVQSTKFFTGKISQMFDKNPDKIYFIKNCLQNENNISCGDYKSDTLNKSVEIPVTNLSENMLKLKKGQRLAEITIKGNTEVYVCFPRNKRDKLPLKWAGPVRIIKTSIKHPSYLIEYQKQWQMVTKWATREKRRWNQQNQNDIYNEQSNTLILDKESSKESDEEKITIPQCNNRYKVAP